MSARSVTAPSDETVSRAPVKSNVLELLSLENVAFGDPRFVGDGPIGG